MKATRIIAVAALIVGSSVALYVARAQQAGIKRTDLERHDLGVPGREVVQAHVELDPGVSFGKHWHSSEEMIYVLEGSLEYSVEGKLPVTLKAARSCSSRPERFTRRRTLAAATGQNSARMSSKKAGRSS